MITEIKHSENEHGDDLQFIVKFEDEKEVLLLKAEILKATGMENCNPNKIPAAKTALGADPDGTPMEDKWNYRSIVGMLLYLTTNTRPDITFAVSQVARFSHAPKESHASAVKTIVRYLKGTKQRGTIFRRPSSFSLDCYADADFAGVDAHVLLDRVSPGQQILNQIRYLGLHSRQWMSPP